MPQRESGMSTIWVLVGILAVVLIGAAGYFIYQSSQSAVPTQPTPSASSSQAATSDRLIFASKEHGFKVALPKDTWANYKTYESTRKDSNGGVTRVGFFLPYQANSEANKAYKADVAGYAEIFHVLVVKKTYYNTLTAEDKKAINGKTLLTTGDTIYTYYYTGDSLPTFSTPFTTAKAETEKVLKTLAAYK